MREQARNETIDGQHVFAAGKFTYVSGASGDYVGVHLSVSSQMADLDTSVASADPHVVSIGANHNGAVEVVSNFSMSSGDVLSLHDLLTSISAPHDNTAFIDGFVQFVQSGSDTQVQIDSDGSAGDVSSMVTLATLTNVLLTQADTANYAL